MPLSLELADPLHQTSDVSDEEYHLVDDSGQAARRSRHQLPPWWNRAWTVASVLAAVCVVVVVVVFSIDSNARDAFTPDSHQKSTTTDTANHPTNDASFTSRELESTASCSAEALIEKHEGTRSCVYTDTTGHPTIGIGYNLDDTGAPEAIAAIGANYNKVRSGAECLSNRQIKELFQPAYNAAVAEAKRVVSSFPSLCCNVQKVLIDMTYNLGSLSSFNTFVSLVNSHEWSSAANDGRHTAWCGQVGDRCTEDMEMLAQGCSGSGASPNPPAPTGPSPSPPAPTGECVACVQYGGGKACADRCQSCGSQCLSCVQYDGGKACADRCC